MQYEYRNKEIIVIFDYFDQRKLWDMIRECDTASGGVTPQTPADEFPGGVRFVLAFLGKIVYTTLVHAGVLELVDEVDSKSTGGNTVPVRARPPAPKIDKHRQGLVDFYLFTLHFSLFSKFVGSIFGRE